MICANLFSEVQRTSKCPDGNIQNEGEAGIGGKTEK